MKRSCSNKKSIKFYLFTSDYGATSRKIKIKTDFLTKIINKNNQITLKNVKFNKIYFNRIQIKILKT